MFATPATAPEGAPLLAWLTLERALFGLVLLVAFGLRVFGLADPPLSPAESQRALAAWQLGANSGPEWWDAPAFVVANAGVFFAFGAGDVTARALPLLGGLLTIAALWMFRPWIGGLAVVVAGAMLALSPLHWTASRTASEDTLAVLVTMLLLWGLLRFDDDYHPLYRPLSATGLAVLVNLGAPGITGALALALGAACVYAVQPQGMPAPLLFRVLVSRPLSRSLLPFLSVFVLLGTGCFLFLKGFGFPSLPAWVHAAAPASGRFPWYESWLLLGGHELFALALGVPAAVLFLARWVQAPTLAQNQARGLWAVWALLSLTLLILGGQPDSTALFMAAFPLVVVTGIGIADLLQGIDVGSVRGLAAVSLPVAGLLWFAFMAIAHNLETAPDRGVPFIAMVSGLGAVLVLLLTALASVQPRGTLGLTAAILAGLFAVQALGGMAASGLRPLETRVDAAGVAPLTERLRLSKYTGGQQAQRVAIETELRPVYAWQLRDVPGVSYVRVVEPGPDLVVAGASTNLPPLPEYRRRALPFARTWVPQGWSWADTWRWIMWNQAAPGSLQDQRVVLMERTS